MSFSEAWNMVKALHLLADIRVTWIDIQMFSSTLTSLNNSDRIETVDPQRFFGPVDKAPKKYGHQIGLAEGLLFVPKTTILQEWHPGKEMLLVHAPYQDHLPSERLKSGSGTFKMFVLTKGCRCIGIPAENKRMQWPKGTVEHIPFTGTTLWMLFAAIVKCAPMYNWLFTATRAMSAKS